MWQDISLFSGCVIVYMWSRFSAIWNANLTHFVLATFMNIKNMDKIIVNTWKRSIAPNFSAMKFSYWCSRKKIENFTSLYCHECPKFNWKFHFKCTLSGTSWWHETLMPMTQQPPKTTKFIHVKWNKMWSCRWFCTSTKLLLYQVCSKEGVKEELVLNRPGS